MASSSGARTPASGLAPDTLRWQTWWEFNKEPYLLPRVAKVRGPQTGSDDFYLGARRRSQPVEVPRATTPDRRDRILPALVKLMQQERNRDVQSACLVAMGKIGLDAGRRPLVRVLAERIQRDDQEVRETAVLALGISGQRAAFDMLLALAGDDEKGRKLARREHVRGRTRAFAAYGLGLLARSLGEPELSQRAHDLLLKILLDEELRNDRDLRTAAVNALGALRADAKRSADKRLAWQTSEELLRWFERDLGRGDEAIQAHAPIAIARLLGRGTSPVHRRCKQVLAAALEKKSRRGPLIVQSSAVALGMLAVAAEEHPADKAISAALQHYWRKGRDQQARRFAVIALARIGGAGNREWLGKAYAKASKALEQPWVAIALGVLCESAGAAGKPDRAIAEMLLSDLYDAPNDDRRSALAVALGLTGYRDAAPHLQRLLRDHESDARSAGYLAVGLGLLRDRTSTLMLTQVMQRSARRPFLLQQCAVALGCLGDPGASKVLIEMMGKAESIAVLAAISSAIGRIGDRGTIRVLVGLSGNRAIGKLGRAFVAAALGGVGDKVRLPWNVPLSIDCNYATNIDTLSNGRSGVLDIL
ncbi:MAG: HEAT repeat domain-containing protein [Planctomycetota bacterium]